MAILVNKETRLLVQGITGKAGGFHARMCMEYGTNLVAGVTPGKGGERFEGKVPVFDTVAEARRETGCNASMVFVPAEFAADAILEAADAGVELIVCITEGIPVIDMMRVNHLLRDYPSSRLIGPNCPGVITPGQCKIGIMPGYIHKPGRVGVVSRSGTLTYEAVWQLTARTRPIHLRRHRRRPDQRHLHLDVVRMFAEDPDTDAHHHDRRDRRHRRGGGRRLDQSALPQTGRRHSSRAPPRPPGRRMGHAGAIVSGGKGTAQGKIAALHEAGISVAETPADMAEALLRVYKP
jgi:succinyl-CoA synthetase alpha subunit